MRSVSSWRAASALRAVSSARSADFRGFGLLETLIALVVLSVGLLGIAVLFGNGIRATHAALLRTHAVNLVSDMADRIRANTDGGAAYDMATYGGAPVARNCAPGDPATSANNCTAAELAEDDLARWLRAVRAELPENGGNSPSADVRYFGAESLNVPVHYRVAISWREPGEEGLLSYQSEVVVTPRLPPRPLSRSEES